MNRSLRKLFCGSFLLPAVLLVMLPGTCLSAEDAADDVASLSKNYPAGSIQSDAAADDALLRTDKAREDVERQFIDEERVCYSRFFVNACLSDAKEKRHLALSRIKRVEIEANQFKRASRVKQNDRLAAQRASEERSLQVSSESKPKTVRERVAEHEEKLKEIRQREIAEAPQRARNEEAYERKVKEAEERRRKAEKPKAK